MEKLSVRELLQDGVPEMILDVFAGKCCTFINECFSRVVCLHNYIDGAALSYDINEFKMLVPQCGIRMKIKMIITKHWDMAMNKVQ